MDVKVSGIIDLVKTLSNDEILLFEKEFKKIVNPIKKEIKEKKDNDKSAKIKDLCKEICELADIEGIPVSAVAKAYDAPYEVWFPDEDYPQFWEDTYKNLDEETCKKIDDLTLALFDLIGDMYEYKREDGNDLYSGWKKTLFLGKDGEETWEEIYN